MTDGLTLVPQSDAITFTLPEPPYVLHLGCGEHRVLRVDTPPGCSVIRFDSDPDCEPDIVGDIRTDLTQFPDGCARLIHVSHLLEHIHRVEAGPFLRECKRLLAPDGVLQMWMPDGQRIGEELADGRVEDTAYRDVQGNSIRPLDMIYGLQEEVVRGVVGMQHRCLYTARSLRRALEDAGFPDFVCVREGWELKAKAWATPRVKEWGN